MIRLIKFLANLSNTTKHAKHPSECESVRSASTATNYNNITASTEKKVYVKPPMIINQVLKIGGNNISVSSDNNRDSFVSNHRNSYNQMENIVTTQNNYINTVTNNNNSKNSRKSSTSSNQSYLLNFKEKQKLTGSNSKNIEKKGY